MGNFAQVSVSTRGRDGTREWAQSRWLLLIGSGMLVLGLSLIVLAIATQRTTSTRVAMIVVGVSLIEGWGASALIRRGIASSALSSLGRFRGYIAAIVVAAAFVGFTLVGNPHVRGQFLTISVLKITAIPIAICASWCEELIFRGWLMDRLASRGRGIGLQIFVSGVAFGLFHAYGFGGLSVALAAQAATTVLGLMLATVYVLAGRRLGPAILGHALVDLLIEPWLIVGFFS